MSPSLRPVPAVSPLSALQGALSGLASLAAGAPAVLRVLSGAHARLLRCWDGRVPDPWFGARLLVLETIGRRSGRLRSTPLVFVRSGEDLVVAATNAGADRQPDWWCNLRSAGEAIVVVDGRRGGGGAPGRDRAGGDPPPSVAGGYNPDPPPPRGRPAGVAAVYTPKDFGLTAIMGGIVDVIRRANDLP